MSRTIFVALGLMLAVAASAEAQYGGQKKAASAGPALPPFLASMQRSSFNVRVVERLASGESRPVDAGTAVSMQITAGGTRIRDYDAETSAGGIARLEGVPYNPEVQAQIGYQLSVEHAGVSFPFSVERLPSDGETIEVDVYGVTHDISQVSVEHSFIEVMPYEDYLVVRHALRLRNGGPLAVDLSTQPRGGLALPMPDGAKHPELHDDGTKVAEVRGKDLYYIGALLPGDAGVSDFRLVYTIPYRDDVFHWDQAMPVPAHGAQIAVWRSKREGQRVEVPLTLTAAASLGDVRESNTSPERRFWSLRAPTLNLAPGESLRFEIGGIPAFDKLKHGLLLGSIGLIFLFIVFGFRRSDALRDTTRLSRAHLEDERDRLSNALRRLRKAVDRGRITRTRFEREQEAITARLVTLYTALDKLDGR